MTVTNTGQSVQYPVVQKQPIKEYKRQDTKLVL